MPAAIAWLAARTGMPLQLTVALVVGGGLVVMALAVLALRGRLVVPAAAPAAIEVETVIVSPEATVLPGQLLAKRASDVTVSAN